MNAPYDNACVNLEKELELLRQDNATYKRILAAQQGKPKPIEPKRANDRNDSAETTPENLQNTGAGASTVR